LPSVSTCPVKDWSCDSSASTRVQVCNWRRRRISGRDRWRPAPDLWLDRDAIGEDLALDGGHFLFELSDALAERVGLRDGRSGSDAGQQ